MTYTTTATEPRWVTPNDRYKVTVPVEYSALSINSTVEFFQREIQMLEEEVDRLRKSKHREVVIEAVKALRCPCCNAPIQFGSKPYILEEQKTRRKCEYCGCLLEFLTKE